MNVDFSARDDLQVDAHLGPDWPVVDHALGDSILSLPPRGSPGNAPSTYWIDQAERGAIEAHRSGDTCPFLWGNITILRVIGDTVGRKLRLRRG